METFTGVATKKIYLKDSIKLLDSVRKEEENEENYVL